ncbi:MAG TPA: NAD-binding protein [Candidatus Dormibacteraeota bacterium]|nr:NAD-binding protein [Candidatus Dormibacteraeota bacterium]
MSERSIAIIGGGPIGIEAALEAKRRGFDVTVYEADRVGGHLLRFCHVGLFTPFAMNSTEAGREALRAAGVAVPRYDDLLTASELVGRYLSPLAGLPELRSSIREGERVTHVGREGFAKGQGIAGTGDGSREGAPFLIRVEGPDRLTRLDRADVVIDASGVYANPNATGPGGLPALGEDRVSDRIDRWIPAVRGEAMDRYRGRTILLIGDGHSAATFLTEMGALAEERGWDSGIEIHWVHRERGRGAIFPEVENDPLPARRDLTARANSVVRSAAWITRHPGATVDSYDDTWGGRLRARLRYPAGEERRIEVDRVLALVGYRPDTTIYRELQVHLCYASEGPMSLAAAVLSAGQKSPGRAGDCLSQVAHGPESLRTPEPGFFILGSKSYGRNPAFLLTIGHQQILDTLSLLGAEQTVLFPGCAPRAGA